MTLKTPQDQQAVNARPTPQWDFAPEGALASSPQVGLGGAGGRALLSSILNAYVKKKTGTMRFLGVHQGPLSHEGQVRFCVRPDGAFRLCHPSLRSAAVRMRLFRRDALLLIDTVASTARRPLLRAYVPELIEENGLA